MQIVTSGVCLEYFQRVVLIETFREIITGNLRKNVVYATNTSRKIIDSFYRIHLFVTRDATQTLKQCIDHKERMII